MNPLLSATALVQWADQRRSQDMLPLLIRRLILATVNPIKINFAAGDSVNRPGYDGFLQTTEGGLLVPAGQSVWEMGCNQNPITKANKDYLTRTSDPGQVVPDQTTFVFVTPRRWQDKEDWAADRRAEKYWHDVQVLDADDLEQWLDRSPAVAVWARTQIVGAPDGLLDLQEVWESWKTRTVPELVPQIFMAGRRSQADALKSWLDGPPTCIRLRGDTAQEVIGFVAAAMQSMDENARERALSRTIVVSTPEAWRMVTNQRSPLFVIAKSSFGNEMQAVSRGHHVAVAFGNDVAGLTFNIQLPHLRRADLEAALQLMKFDFDRSNDIANESRGRLAAVIDLLGGGNAPPRWAMPAIAPQLVPFFLAGSWCETANDLELLAILARISTEEISQLMSRWANESDPPVRLVGGVWEWVSRQRGWQYLARHITSADLTAFGHAVTSVLTENDPRFELSPDKRWMANLYNRSPKYSGQLQTGMAEALVILAANPTATLTSVDVSGMVKSIVGTLFKPQADPRRWYSLSPILPLLAEADPDIFINVVDRDVLRGADVRDAIFTEEGFFGGSRSHHLLWALEMLAWAPEHLSGVTLLLAALSATDPGGKSSNRPASSLRTIFLPWFPATTATVVQRLIALDVLRAKYPPIAFDLCVRLLPARHGDTSMPTPRPKWRQRVLQGRPQVPVSDYSDYVSALWGRAMNWASHDQRCWARLMEFSLLTIQTPAEELITRLESLPLHQIANEPGQELRRAIRGILHYAGRHSGADDRMPSDLTDKLDSIYNRLTPSNAVSKDAWLFDHTPHLLTVAERDWQLQQDSVAIERQKFVDALITSNDPNQITRLVECAATPWAVGFHVGRSFLTDAELLASFSSKFDSGNQKHSEYARAIIWGRFQRSGWDWVTQISSTPEFAGWQANQKIAFASALPFEASTWDLVETWGTEIADKYWRSINASWLNNVKRDFSRAVGNFLAKDRPLPAFSICSLCFPGNQTEISFLPTMLDVVRSVTRMARGEIKIEGNFAPDSSFAFQLSQMLDVIAAASITTEEELAQIEWTWLPVIVNSARGAAVLHNVLAREPKMFAEVVSVIYRPDSPSSEEPAAPADAEFRRNRITQAHHLLSEWRRLPGLQQDGTLNTIVLKTWVINARTACQQSDHSESGDAQIGQVLARAQKARMAFGPTKRSVNFWRNSSQIESKTEST